MNEIGRWMALGRRTLRIARQRWQGHKWSAPRSQNMLIGVGVLIGALLLGPRGFGFPFGPFGMYSPLGWHGLFDNHRPFDGAGHFGRWHEGNSFAPAPPLAPGSPARPVPPANQARTASEARESAQRAAQEAREAAQMAARQAREASRQAQDAARRAQNARRDAADSTPQSRAMEAELRRVEVEARVTQKLEAARQVREQEFSSSGVR